MTRTRRIILTLICCIIMTTSVAQTRKVMNRPYIDQRLYHYGFLAGLNMMDLEIENNGYIDEDGNQWFAEVPNYDPGFCVGILGEVRLNKCLAARAVPTMHFGTRSVTFRNALNEDTQVQQMKTTYISVPLDLKFSAERFNNYRPYMMAGINPTLNLTVKKNKNLLVNKFDCFMEVGIGCDFYLPFFKFIPELKFCYGLSNIIDKDRSDLMDADAMIYTKSVDRAVSKMIVLTFYFE
ncbi:MAG: PorT family protein [Prevotellaceae bacterium]|nr:PorT family protein [Candidatus Colivivens equi]